MNSELSQRPVWRRMGRCLVTSELFLDVVYTAFCDCACPFCISRTEEYAEENKSAWMRAARDAFSLFDIKNVILLGERPRWTRLSGRKRISWPGPWRESMWII